MPRPKPLRFPRSLEARLARARRDYERRHPERERQRIIDEAKRLRPHPFLVLAAAAGDKGERPLSASAAHHNPSVQVIELDTKGQPTGGPVLAVKAGKQYQLRCLVTNLGQVPALMGIAEFFVADRHQLAVSAADPSVPLPAFGYAGFTAPQGKTVAVACNKVWKPSQDQVADAGVLAQVYDPTADFLQKRFDPARDRHVGRFDVGGASDFVGKWMGTYEGPVGKEPEIRVEVKQQGETLIADIVFDSTVVPPQKATGKQQGQQAVLTSGPLLPNFPQSKGKWTLSFVNPATVLLKHEITDKDGSKITGQANLSRVL